VRLSPADRRRALVDAAAALLTREGVDAVQFADVASGAGVTRQLVYRFFPNRPALIVAVLEDFADELARRFGEGTMAGTLGSLDATRVFVEAVCDTIEIKGAGAWRLLAAHGPDAAVARRARAIEEKLLAPWHARVVDTTGATRREVATLMRMIVAAGRAVLDRWSAGELTRAEAVRDATRGVSALLQAFAGGPAASRQPS
jgi:AcrR family transcriptional regulator